MSNFKRIRITSTAEIWETSTAANASRESIVSYFGNMDGVGKIEQLAPNNDYFIFDGYDQFNSKEIFRVHGKVNDYVGEWHNSKFSAIDELKELISVSDVILWEVSL